jgi:hypothetical protein
MEAPGKFRGFAIESPGATGGEGGRIPMSPPPLLAGETMGNDRQLVGTRFGGWELVEAAPVMALGGARRRCPLRLAVRRGKGGRGARRRTVSFFGT